MGSLRLFTLIFSFFLCIDLYATKCTTLLEKENPLAWFNNEYQRWSELTSAQIQNPLIYGGIEGAKVAIFFKTSDNFFESKVVEGTLSEIKKKLVQVRSRTYDVDYKTVYSYEVRLSNGTVVSVEPATILAMRFHVLLTAQASFEHQYSTWHDVSRDLFNSQNFSWINRKAAFLVKDPSKNTSSSSGILIEGKIEAIEPYSTEIYNAGGYVEQNIFGVNYSVRTSDGTLKQIPSGTIIGLRAEGNQIRVFK